MDLDVGDFVGSGVTFGDNNVGVGLESFGGGVPFGGQFFTVSAPGGV